MCIEAKATRNQNTPVPQNGNLWCLFPLHRCIMSNVNRRTFLASAAVATAAASRLSAAESDKLRVGFIGVGNRGTTLLRNFLEAKLGTVVAVCDIKDVHAKRAAKIITDAEQKVPKLI